MKSRCRAAGWLLALPLAIAPALALAWPWSRDMMNQPSIKPQEGVMTPFPKNSIPVGGLETPGLGRLESYRLANPVPATPASVARGKTYFAVFCVPCHGVSGRGDGPVAKKLPVPPMDLTNAFIQKDSFDSWVFAMITHGGRVMPAYKADLSVSERWDIVNYVRGPLAQSATLAAAAPAASAPAKK